MTLVLLNDGEDAQFTLSVNTAAMGANASDSFQYILTPRTIFLESNVSAMINVEITVSSNVTNELAITFTVVAESAVHNDFATFSIITSTRPPPEFTENVRMAKIIILTAKTHKYTHAHPKRVLS